MKIPIKNRSVFAVAGLGFFGVALSALGLYYSLDKQSAPAAVPSLPPTMTSTPTNSSPPAPSQGAPRVSTMEQAADRLAKRLAQQDGSADDWALLARSYVELRQYGDAERAFARAIEKSPGDVALKKEAAAASVTANRAAAK